MRKEAMELLFLLEVPIGWVGDWRVERELFSVQSDFKVGKLVG